MKHLALDEMLAGILPDRLHRSDSCSVTFWTGALPPVLGFWSVTGPSPL